MADYGRSRRMLARQQVAMLQEPEIWDGVNGVSIVDENPDTEAGAAAQEGGNGYRMLDESAVGASQGGGTPETFMHRIGDLCPECGQASVVNEEGCRKCYSCGFSEC